MGYEINIKFGEDEELNSAQIGSAPKHLGDHRLERQVDEMIAKFDEGSHEMLDHLRTGTTPHADLSPRYPSPVADQIGKVIANNTPE